MSPPSQNRIVNVRGLALSILCFFASVAILWVGYTCTSEGPGLTSRFESTPKEGYDYWIRKEFWQNIRWFSVYAVLALGGFLLPLIAAFRGQRHTGPRSRASRMLFIMATIYFAIWLVGFAACSPFLLNAPLVLLVPGVLLLGSIFAMKAFMPQSPRRVATTAPRS